MKLLLVVCVCVCFAHSLKLKQETIDKWTEMSHPHVENCVEKSGVDKALADSVYTNLDYPDDQQFKCYMDCMAKKFGVLDSNNKFDQEKISDSTAPLDRKIVDDCVKKAEQSLNTCEVGYVFGTCIILSVAEQQNL
ncbi:hypothetical protein PPYR_02532 [Photinus pyralis]|uniref:Uncharacterized protein n=1 Tax=Photinus pyralis TaxID=7054 RepID=A0A5N4B7H8_PHOPY|nr:general odorant-binding protein 99a-like [Photinus pyralis]KAB0805562.1 hypothetical protein PPYR_02532 [Photinus pyralis]